MVQQGALGGINQRNKEAKNQAAPPSPIPSGGINQLMNQKVDAYKSNPQALEKRYQQNQQLIDLLALQKIKTDKTTAANNIALQMQQNPSTIAQQREQEVLAMTKNEMAQQTTGILGQRQKQQQKNMQRTAKGQNVAPQGGAMMAARGGLMPLPRPTMQKMASGGILGYNPGGEVISDEELAELGMTREQYMARVLESRGLKTPVKSPTPEEQKEQENARIAKLEEDNRLLAEELGIIPAGSTTPKAEVVTTPKAEVVTAPEAKVVTGPTSTGIAATGPTPTDPVPTGIAAELPVVKPVDTSTLQQNRVSSRLDPAVTSVLQEDMLADPTALGIAARTDQDEFAKRKEFFDKRQENIAGIAALNKQDFDPDKLAKQRRLAALAPYNDSVRGMLQADNAVENARYNRELVNVRLDDASMKEDSAIAAKSGEIGQKMYTDIIGARSVAAKAYASMSAADQVAVDAEAKRILEADKSNLSAKLEQLKIESNNSLRIAIEGSQTLGQLQQRYREIIEIKDKAVKAVNDNIDVRTREALIKIKEGKGETEDIALQTKYNSVIANIMAEKYAPYEEYILAEIARVSGVPFPKAGGAGGGGAGGGATGGNFDPDL